MEKFNHKYKMVTWLVSKCETPGGGEKYVEELGKYVDVDIFGSCGLKPLLPRLKKFWFSLYSIHLSKVHI